MKIKKLNEAHYGGAFDIEDDQFFTREDINEFAYYVCDALINKFGYRYEPYDVGMETPKKLHISIEDVINGFLVEYTLNIDMRRIRIPRDLYNRYGDKVVNEFAKLFNAEYQEANLDESLNMKEYNRIGSIRNGGKVYNLYRKIEGEKRKWLAIETNNGNEVGEPFEITYEQARGFEPINSVGKLQRKLGKVLLPKHVVEDLNEAHVHSSIDFDDRYVYIEYKDMPIEVNNSHMAWDYDKDAPIEVGNSYMTTVDYVYKVPRDWFEEYLWDLDTEYDKDYYTDSDLEASISKFRDKILDNYYYDAEREATNNYMEEI